jgi:hypothetical protein
MKLLKKYIGLFIVALYLFVPLAGIALANPNPDDNWLSGKSLCFISTSSAAPVQNLLTCDDNDTEVDNADCSYRSHLPLISSPCRFSPIKTRLKVIEIRKDLPYIYTAIFVPPQ